MSPLNSKSESGYTLQTLIIIAILVLATTTASVLLYAVLRDSTSRIAGGSETFDGLPGGPQNLRVESKPSGATNAVDLTISWEAPSYLGEFPPTGYEFSINEDDTPVLITPMCDSPLVISDENFTYDNSCRVLGFPVDNTAVYELLFTINLGSASGGTSPGGLTFYRELSLSTGTSPPNAIQTRPLPDAMELSWDAESDVVYRLHIELTGTDYYQCFASSGGMVTREAPNVNERKGTQNNIALTRNEMPPPSTGRPKYEYTIKLSASTSVPSTLDNSYCMTDSNFGESVDVSATFGTPPIPEITLETQSTPPPRPVGTTRLATLEATLSSCEEDMDTEFFWEEAGKSETQSSQTIAGCGSTSSCTSDCELIVRGDFVVGTEYELWAITSNDIGTNTPTQRQPWIPSAGPGTPRNAITLSGGDGIVISWEAPKFILEDGLRGYLLRSAEKTTPSCPRLTTNPREIPSDTLQYTFETQENHQTYCFQLSSFSVDSTSNESESSRLSFETAYADPLTVGTGEFRLNWKTSPGAEYYTIRWAPLTQDTACSVTSDLDAPALQPPKLLSATLIDEGEESLSYTIPALSDHQYLLQFTTVYGDENSISWSRYVCSPP